MYAVVPVTRTAHVGTCTQAPNRDQSEWLWSADPTWGHPAERSEHEKFAPAAIARIAPQINDLKAAVTSRLGSSLDSNKSRSRPIIFAVDVILKRSGQQVFVRSGKLKKLKNGKNK